MDFRQQCLKRKQEISDFFTEDVTNYVYNETTRYAQQHLATYEDYLREHKYARENSSKLNPLKKEEINPLLAVIIFICLVTFPTIN